MRRAGALALIAAATPGVFAGCVSIPQGPGFQQVQDAVRDRSGQTIYWDQQAPQAFSPEEVVQALLQKELTAESAVEVALLNNRRLQATFEELEITRAELVHAAGGKLEPGEPSEHHHGGHAP